MASIRDDRGYNQGFMVTNALIVRTERRCEEVLGHFREDRKALEIGCGIGLHAYIIAKEKKNVQVVSTDICEPFIQEASKNYKLKNLKYQVLDFSDNEAVKELLFKEGQFDYVFGDGILHHLFFKLDNALYQLNKLLKQGGKIIFWEPNICNPYCFLIFKNKFFRTRANMEPAEMAFSKKHIRKILSSNGFDQIKISHLDFLLPNTPYPLINYVIKAGSILEKIPLVNRLSQSILISARKIKD